MKQTDAVNVTERQRTHDSLSRRDLEAEKEKADSAAHDWQLDVGRRGDSGVGAVRGFICCFRLTIGQEESQISVGG